MSYTISSKFCEPSGIPLKCGCENRAFNWHTRGKKGLELVCTKCGKLWFVEVKP